MLLRWLGGKNRLSAQIIGTFPEHQRYIEPFFGGGAVYFRKTSAKESIINDVNAELMNLYQVVRDEPQELVRMIQYTPFSEAMFDILVADYWGNREKWVTQSSVRRAFGYYYIIKCSFNSMGKIFAVNAGGQSNWLGDGILETIKMVTDKLQKDTVILTRDYKDVLSSFGNDKTLVYLDPPYAVTIKEATTYYEYVMAAKEHEALRDILITAPFKWVLSYDIHPFVYELYKDFAPLVRIYETSKVFQSSSNRNSLKYESVVESSAFKQELLLTNFDIQQSLPLFQ